MLTLTLTLRDISSLVRRGWSFILPTTLIRTVMGLIRLVSVQCLISRAGSIVLAKILAHVQVLGLITLLEQVRVV